MVHFTHHNPWLYNPGVFRESFGSSGGLSEKVASWDRPQVWWTAGRRQWPGPADLHGSTNGSTMVCTTKKHDIGWSWNSEPLFMGWFRNVQNSASVSTRWKYTCGTLSCKMISIHTLRQLNSLLWKPWPMKAHDWLIISITITHGKLLDCRGDQSIHINSNYDRLGEATFEKGRETATSPSLFIFWFLTLCHTQMTKQALHHMYKPICKYYEMCIYIYTIIHTHKIHLLQQLYIKFTTPFNRKKQSIHIHFQWKMWHPNSEIRHLPRIPRSPPAWKWPPRLWCRDCGRHSPGLGMARTHLRSYWFIGMRIYI